MGHTRMRFVCEMLLLITNVVSAKFLWGTATAAYQVEGYRNVSSRQPSIWDCFDTPMAGSNGVSCEGVRASKPNTQPNIYKRENAATADSDYTKYSDTVQELTKFGFGAYRMSISWSRVISYTRQQDGSLHSSLNREGIDHYGRVLRQPLSIPCLCSRPRFPFINPLNACCPCSRPSFPSLIPSLHVVASQSSPCRRGRSRIDALALGHTAVP